MAARTPDEIRTSIEANRKQLGAAVERLRDDVAEMTDWRKQIRHHQRNLIIGAAVAGFVIGGGVGGLVGLFRRSR
jgi:hypothetical protein